MFMLTTYECVYESDSVKEAAAQKNSGEELRDRGK